MPVGALVYYDLELSAGGLDAEILQIGAVCRHKRFKEFIMPKYDIQWGSSRINGFTRQNGRLYRDGEQVDAVSLRVGLENFLEFLSRFGDVVLVAHDGINSDDRYLIRDINRLNLRHWFDDVVVGSIDTLPLFRKELNRTKYCKQSDLAAEFLGEKQTHDALDDAYQLRELVRHMKIPDCVMRSDIFLF